MSKIAYTIEEAAAQVSLSEKTLYRAIKATDPNSFPPPLAAKNFGSDRKPSYRVMHDVLTAWANGMKDA